MARNSGSCPPREPFAQLLPAGGPLARWLGLALPWIPKSLVARVVKRLLVTWQHPENALFDDGAILVNRAGERFCNERAWPGREIAVSRQPDKLAYLVLDERLTARYSRWPHFISTAPEIAYAYVDDYLRLRPDVAVAADSLDEVAALRDIPADALRDTIADYNAAAGKPDRFGRARPSRSRETVGCYWGRSRRISPPPKEAPRSTRASACSITAVSRSPACTQWDRWGSAGKSCGATDCTSPGR